jgi:heme exporter protein C
MQSSATWNDQRLLRAIRFTGIAAMALLAVGALMAAFHAPLLPGFDDPECEPPHCHTSPVGQKIFYFHVPVAWTAYLAFILLAIASYQVLSTQRDHWDSLAVASAEVGVLLTALTLFTGSMWGHLEWGIAYWNPRDMKLMLTLVMFLVYVAYLILRRQLTDPRKRSRIAAVYGLLGFAAVPLSYMAQRVWASIHPDLSPLNPEGGVTTPGIRETFYLNVVAFIALALFLILTRYRIEMLRRQEQQARHAQQESLEESE